MLSQSGTIGGRRKILETALTWSVLVDDGRCLPSPGVIHPNKTGPTSPLHHFITITELQLTVQLDRVVNVSG